MSNDHKKSSLMGKRGLILAIALGLAIIIAVVQHQASIAAFLAKQKLAPAPERYTELYFDHNVNLPTTLTTNPVTFSFSVHNMEGSRMSYPYTVTVKPLTGIAHTLSTNSVTLDDNAVATIPEKLTLPQTDANSEITIFLPNQQQEIHLWLRANQ